MILGVAKEILEGERRVAALPEAVRQYADMGFDVLVEASAGEGVFHSDAEYESLGARIAGDAEELYARSDVVLKVKQPVFNEKLGKHEAEMLREGAVLVTFLHPAAPANHAVVRSLRDRNVTAFTMDGIPRTSRAQRMDALTSMSMVTGYKAVLTAANRLAKLVPMTSTAIGATKPAAFLVVGAGVVGLQAIATAKRLGGAVQAVDIRPEAREAAGSLGAKIGGFEAPKRHALGKGGYAKHLPEKWLRKERDALAPLVKAADVLILCALVPNEVAPVLVTREMVEGMQPGSVIVDVSVDQGGNCEATEPGKEMEVGASHLSGRLNIPGSVPVHASWLYSSNVCEYVKNLFKKGVGTLDMDDDIVQASLVTHQGRIVHESTLKAMGEA